MKTSHKIGPVPCDFLIDGVIYEVQATQVHYSPSGVMNTIIMPDGTERRVANHLLLHTEGDRQRRYRKVTKRKQVTYHTRPPAITDGDTLQKWNEDGRKGPLEWTTVTP